jgi:diguanylate cyclase (GGDEF)-like protein
LPALPVMALLAATTTALLGTPGPAVAAPVVLLGTAILLAAAAGHQRSRPGVAAAGWLLAATAAGLAATRVAWSLTGEPTGVWPAAALTAGCLAQLAGVWLVVRGRSPRWAPSTGWDGSVVALGAAALGVGAFELAITLAGEQRLVTAGLAPVAGTTTLFVAGLTALAVAAPSPRPQVRRLAAGLSLIAAADLVALARDGGPALLDPDTPALLLVALAGHTVIGLSVVDRLPLRPGDQRRLGDRRADRLGFLGGRAGGHSGSVAGAVVIACIGVVGAAVLSPQAPRVGAVLALACLGVALLRTREALHEVQQLSLDDLRPRTDDLTGLANRRALSEALAGDHNLGDDDTGWSGWAGWSDEIALLLVDLDRFKDVNDALGHEAGDRLLALVGTRLRTALRPTQLLARLGGDEFAVVLPAAGADQARRVAEALRASLREPFLVDGARLHVEASIGAATCHPSRGEPTDLLRQADVAMYQAKAIGTGIELYDPARDDGGTERLRRTDELREALERGDLEVHIQPQVELRTGVIVGAEALARWRHPEDGVLLPDSFLPLAEHTGLMRPVAALVLDRALEACATWWAAGFEVPVSVNLGADDLRDPSLPGRVTELLAKHGLPPGALRVEITEQTLLTDPAAASVVLGRWRADGVAVAIDDFGTGYSSLSYLRELPIDEVKLDRAFIADIRRPTTGTIVRHTVAMAHGLWARVVAEGIEDEGTARIITDLGCDLGQGNYFGAAMTPREFVGRLRAQTR